MGARAAAAAAAEIFFLGFPFFIPFLPPFEWDHRTLRFVQVIILFILSWLARAPPARGEKRNTGSKGRERRNSKIVLRDEERHKIKSNVGAKRFLSAARREGPPT